MKTEQAKENQIRTVPTGGSNMENQIFTTHQFAKALNANGIRANASSICRAVTKGQIDYELEINGKFYIGIYELERVLNTADFLNNNRVGNIKSN